MRILGENDLLFPSLNIFDAFELDVDVVNFVYYGKTRINTFLSRNFFSFNTPWKSTQNNVLT